MRCLMLMLTFCAICHFGSAQATVPYGRYAVQTIQGLRYFQGWNNDSYLKEPANGVIECLPRPRAGQWAGPYPVMVFMHSGAWHAGPITQDIDKCRLWASYGFVGICLQFRLIVAGTVSTYWPAQVIDVQAGVRWIRANAARLHVNTWAIGAMGGSSAGQMADFLGWDPHMLVVPADHYGTQQSNAGYASSVQFVISEAGVSWGGPTYRMPGAPDGSANNLIPPYHRSAASTLFVHGTRDANVPASESQYAYNTFLSYGRRDMRYIAFNGGHEFTNTAAAVVDQVRLQEIQWSLQMARAHGSAVP